MNIKLCTLCIISLLLLISACRTNIDPRDAYFKGMRQLARDKPEAVIEIWKPLAASGDCDAQYSYGMLLHLGDGVPKDPEAALEWWQRAANQGQAWAQLTLSGIYLHEIVPAYTFRNNVWISCIRGCGWDKDRIQSYMWARLSRDRGRRPLQRKYSDGFVKMLEGNWEAILEMNPDAESATVNELETGRTISLEESIKKIVLTPDDLAEAERLINEWKPSPVPPKYSYALILLRFSAGSS